VKGVKPITNRQRFDLGGNIALPAWENEFVQGMLIELNCHLRLATAVPLVEGQAVVDVLICKPAEREQAINWVRNLLLDELKRADLHPRR
jgi:hypothetical protein